MAVSDFVDYVGLTVPDAHLKPITRGKTWRRRLWVRRNGDILDPDGLVITGRLCRTWTSATGVDFDVTVGATEDDPTLILELADDVTADLALGGWVFDIEIRHTTEDGVVGPLRGTVGVRPEATR